MQDVLVWCVEKKRAIVPMKCNTVSEKKLDLEKIYQFYYRIGIPYNEDGCLVDWPPGTAIYECNSKCQCDSLCVNRVLQKGVTVLMEVYKTKNRGWGARTLEPIPRGKFVCEYTGEVRQIHICIWINYFHIHS